MEALSQGEERSWAFIMNMEGHFAPHGRFQQDMKQAEARLDRLEGLMAAEVHAQVHSNEYEGDEEYEEYEEYEEDAGYPPPPPPARGGAGSGRGGMATPRRGAARPRGPRPQR